MKEFHRGKNACLILADDELSLLGGTRSVDDIFEPSVSKMCRTCFENYRKLDDLEDRLRSNLQTVLRSVVTSTDAAAEHESFRIRKRSHDGRTLLNPPIISRTYSTSVTVWHSISFIIIYNVL